MTKISTIFLFLFCIQLSYAAEKEKTNISLLKELDRTIAQKNYLPPAERAGNRQHQNSVTCR